MRFRFISLVIVTTALSGAIAHAQEAAHTPETLARVAEGEVGQLDTQSIVKYGDIQGRFDVFIERGDGAPSPDGTTPRRVRYMVNCQEGTMAVAAVGLFDRGGQVSKTMVSPPGAVDPVKPEKGSEEAKWLQRTCLF